MSFHSVMLPPLEPSDESSYQCVRSELVLTKFASSINQRFGKSERATVYCEVHRSDNLEAVLNDDCLSFVCKFSLTIEYRLQKSETLKRKKIDFVEHNFLTVDHRHLKSGRSEVRVSVLK